ncbi:hypothetical protein D3C79_620610 [compost metagenome]
MVGDELEQATYRDHGENERHHEADGKYREVVGLEQLAVFVARVHGGTDHGRHGQEERELGGRLARQAEQQAADDGGAGTRGTRHQRQALGAANLQGIAPAHVVDLVNADHMLAALGPEHDHTTDHQGCGHGDGVEQVLVDQVGEQHPQDHRRHEGDQQVDGKALCFTLTWQPHHHVEDLAAKLPDHRQDRAQLDDDVEGHGPLTTEVDQVGHDDLVAGTGNRQELRQAFDNT